jgi:hypothetical protein
MGSSAAWLPEPVYATTMWDPDGPGPKTPLLVAGGEFSVYGHVAVCDLATGTWSMLGGGTNDGVWCLTAMPRREPRRGRALHRGRCPTGEPGRPVGSRDPELVVARGGREGGVTKPGGNTPYVSAVAAMPNGDLIVGGNFTKAGTIDATGIARWDGTGWSALGDPAASGTVHELLAHSDGSVVVAGDLALPGLSFTRIARWDGQAWSAIGESGWNKFVYALAEMPDGDLIAGGTFTVAAGVSANRIARWDGASWSPLGAGIENVTVNALAALPNGDVVAGGQFWSAGGVAAQHVARWDGTQWFAIGGGRSDPVYTLTPMSEGGFIAGGSFHAAIARWDGAAWTGVGTGFWDPIESLARLADGSLVVGGQFSTLLSGGHQIARWDGSAWSAMGNGLAGGGVHSMKVLSNGDLVAGGGFSKSGSVPVNHVARWDGNSWLALGSGVGLLNQGDNYVFAIEQLPNEHIVAGGQFAKSGGVDTPHIAEWNGTTWSPVGAGVNNIVYALHTLEGGDLVAGGSFTSAGGISANRIARWNGVAWSALGIGLGNSVANSVRALLTLPNGDLVAGGYFFFAGGLSATCVARWDGISWHPMGAGLSPAPGGGSVNAFALHHGHLIAGGRFTKSGATALNHLARWDETLGIWSPVAEGLNDGVGDVLSLPSGDLIVSGTFTTAAQHIATYVARYACPPPPPCQADCDASGSLNIDDFICFQTLFVLGDPAADCDASGSLNIDDFICFQTLFSLGC